MAVAARSGRPELTLTLTRRLLRTGAHGGAGRGSALIAPSISGLWPGRLGEDGVDLRLLPRPAVLGVVQQVEVLDDAPGEAAALEQLVLRLVVVVDAAAAGPLLRDALEVEDVGVLLLDEELGGRLVDGLREERAQGGEGDDRGEDGEEEAAAAEEDVDVVPEVGLALRAGRRTSARSCGVAITPRSARGAAVLDALNRCGRWNCSTGCRSGELRAGRCHPEHV